MTNDTVSLALHGAVAKLTIQRPPVNSLDYATRLALIAAIDQCASDQKVSAIVLAGSGGNFCAGADVKELEDPETFFRVPRIVDVAQCIEACPKPVVAAVEGNCLGGGLEIALAAHYRVAAADAMLGLPEVRIGVLPASGGTQRLPRLIGVSLALKMMLDGSPVAARELAGTAALDLITQGLVQEAAEAFALALPAGQQHVRSSASSAPPDADGEVEAARRALSHDRQRSFLRARDKIVEAVGICVSGSFAQGIAFEQDAARELVFSVESRALRHIFAAERATRKVRQPGVLARKVASVGIIGGGTMGSGIAISFLNSDIPVVLLESSADALSKGLGRIREHYDQALDKGKLDRALVSKRLGLLQGTLDYCDLRDVDIAVEAVFEDMRVKRQVFERLDETCRQGAILATNTSCLDLNVIANFTRRPQDVVGLHFFSPAHAMHLVEVVRGSRTAPEVIATALKLTEQLRKVSVVAGVCDGFIGNRMFVRYVAAAHDLVLAGVSPAQVDRCLEKFGMAMGPFRVGDLAGLDISHAARKRRAHETGRTFVPGVADKLVEAGRLGQKSGAGWYRYEPGSREPIPDPSVDALVEQARQQAGIVVRPISDEEIEQRCVFALVNEGARILEEGVAERASDIDLIYINGYGFPRERGGPMFFADTIGLAKVEAALRRFAVQEPRDPGPWIPAGLLSASARAAKTFN